MATTYLREKIGIVTQLIQNVELERFQHQMAMDISATPSGDAQVDEQMKAQAANSKAQVLAANARLTVYQKNLDTLNAELNGPAPGSWVQTK